MLYTGTVKKAADGWPLPNRSDYLKHTTFQADSRVGILAETPDQKWFWVYELNNKTATVWVEAKNVIKDPILTIDLFHSDCNGKPKWDVAAAAPGYFGAMLKATQGLKYDYADWFIANWKLAKAAKQKHCLGPEWFLTGAYHYLNCGEDGAKQADYFLSVIKQAGGLEDTDIMPIVDVETKGNENCDKKTVINSTKAFANRILEKTGRKTMLYGASLMRDLGITDHMGCDSLFVARYNSKLPKETYESFGWRLKDVRLWQFSDGSTNLTNWSCSIAGFGATDTSISLDGNLTAFRKGLVGS